MQYNYCTAAPLCCDFHRASENYRFPFSAGKRHRMSLILTQTWGGMQSGTHMPSAKTGSRTVISVFVRRGVCASFACELCMRV